MSQQAIRSYRGILACSEGAWSLLLSVRGNGFAASLIFGVLNPGFEPTLEIEARGNPDLLDLGIAFFSVLLFLSQALLLAPLVLHMLEGRRTGQNRPLEYPVAPHVRQAVNEYIDHWPTVELIAVGRSSVEPEAGITIILMSGKVLPPEFEQDLARTVHKARGDQPVVRIFPVLSARQRALEPQAISK